MFLVLFLDFLHLGVFGTRECLGCFGCSFFLWCSCWIDDGCLSCSPEIFLPFSLESLFLFSLSRERVFCSVLASVFIFLSIGQALPQINLHVTSLFPSSFCRQFAESLASYVLYFYIVFDKRKALSSKQKRVSKW